MRPACPPLIFGCPFLNFSRSRSELDLAARRAIKELEGRDSVRLEEYTREGSEAYSAMVERIGTRLGVTSLRYQLLDDMIDSIGSCRERLCTYCWSGCDHSGQFVPLRTGCPGGKSEPSG